MKFEATQLGDAYVIHFEKIIDERGLFARSFCSREFGKNGLKANMVQCNISFNPRKGTLRGMHFQTPPSMEAKLVRCTRGAIFDVIVDLRKSSATYLKHIGVNLNEKIILHSIFRRDSPMDS
jgi:dTDP-4-dehydrorhamnose 3,5-epimerase